MYSPTRSASGGMAPKRLSYVSSKNKGQPFGLVRHKSAKVKL